jgi:hypothetical protein
VQIGTAEPSAAVYPTVMTCCAYCDQPARTRIVSNTEFVCFEHALEFWTGLLVYVKDRSVACAKHEQSCTCRSCEELSASKLRATAIAVAGPSPDAAVDHELRRVADSSLIGHFRVEPTGQRSDAHPGSLPAPLSASATATAG